MADETTLSLPEAITELRRLKRLWQSIERLEGVIRAVQDAAGRAESLATRIATSEAEVLRLEGVVLEARDSTDRTLTDLRAGVQEAQDAAQAEREALALDTESERAHARATVATEQARGQQEMENQRQAYALELTALDEATRRAKSQLDDLEGQGREAQAHLDTINAVLHQTRSGLKQAGVTL